MSVTDDWELSVDDAEGLLATELLAQLRNHGIRSGEQIRVSRRGQDWILRAGSIVVRTRSRLTDRSDHSASTSPARRDIGFAGVIHAEADLSERTDEYLRGNFGAP